MLYFLTGSDRYRLREREHELTATFLARENEAERMVLFLDEEMSDITGRVREFLSGGLFARPRILLLREIGLLPDTPGEALQTLLEETQSSDDCLVIAAHAEKAKKTPPLLKWLSKNATVETFPAFDTKKPETLAAYGKQLIKNIDPQASIQREALFELALRAQGKSGILAQELAKLAAYKNGEMITKSDIDLLSQEPIESNVFFALDALVSGRPGDAIALFRREEKLAVPIQKTLGLCAWQIRRLIEVGELYESGVREAGAIARELDSAPYPIQKILPKISRFPLNRLKRGIALLADLDLGIRSGQMQPGVALDLFVWRF